MSTVDNSSIYFVFEDDIGNQGTVEIDKQCLAKFSSCMLTKMLENKQMNIPQQEITVNGIKKLAYPLQMQYT